MEDPNIPIGAEEEYPRKSAPFSREIIDAARDVIAIQGEKGDIPAHEWNTDLGHETEIRFQNPDGTWGAWTDLKGESGNVPDAAIEYSVDGISWHNTYAETDVYFHLSFDDEVTWTVAFKAKGDKGEQGDPAFELGIEYSEDDITYYNTIQNPTNYIRFSVDNGVTWLAGIYVRGSSGIDGDDGVNQYLYIAWASDNLGANFSLTFNENLHYRAEIQSQVVIANPVSSNFTGLWKYMKGNPGVDGTDAYLYIGYASDNIGTNFSINPGTGLDYMAALSTDTFIDPIDLDASYFTGLWRYTRGVAGVGNYYIELPYQTTLHARCEDITAIIPLGWDIDSGDQISNPLSTNSIDLIIYHNLGKEVVDVVVKSKTIDKQTKLIGPVAYATFEDDDTLDYLCIKSFSTTETILGIFIKFND